MNTIDLIIFIAYCLLILCVGLFVSRGKKGNERDAGDYFLAGRGLAWWAIGASIIASNISACNVVLLSYCVTSMPSRFSPLLIFLCITATVSRMETRPYKEATSGCTGIIRSVAATSALTVISPTAGGQSRSTKSYPPSVLAASSLRKFSLPY